MFSVRMHGSLKQWACMSGGFRAGFQAVASTRGGGQAECPAGCSRLPRHFMRCSSKGTQPSTQVEAKQQHQPSEADTSLVTATLAPRAHCSLQAATPGGRPSTRATATSSRNLTLLLLPPSCDLSLRNIAGARQRGWPGCGEQAGAVVGGGGGGSGSSNKHGAFAAWPPPPSASIPIIESSKSAQQRASLGNHDWKSAPSPVGL